jgi:inositol oxygenase
MLKKISKCPAVLDPSEHLRPEPVYAGKLKNEFRNYEINPENLIQERVRKTYEEMHTHQTVEFVKCK